MEQYSGDSIAGPDKKQPKEPGQSSPHVGTRPAQQTVQAEGRVRWRVNIWIRPVTLAM